MEQERVQSLQAMASVRAEHDAWMQETEARYEAKVVATEAEAAAELRVRSADAEAQAQSAAQQMQAAEQAATAKLRQAVARSVELQQAAGQKLAETELALREEAAASLESLEAEHSKVLWMNNVEWRQVDSDGEILTVRGVNQNKTSYCICALVFYCPSEHTPG